MLYEVVVVIDDLIPNVPQYAAFVPCFNFLLFFIVDPSKESAFKVAPSKWEAVDESELEAQGETFFKWHQTSNF